MGKEYNNRRPIRRRSSAPQQFLLVIVTFLLGYLTATVFNIETISRWIDAQILAHHEMNQAAQNKPQAQQGAAVPPKPKFEFYTLLTNEKAPNSDLAKANTAGNQPATTNAASAKSTENAVKNTEATVQAAAVRTAAAVAPKTPPVMAVVNKSAASTAVGKGAYSVQVASFKARRDAEQMKGALILKGFNVTIVAINHAIKGSWFRVIVGPYANRTIAQNAQMDLAKKARLHGMLVTG